MNTDIFWQSINSDIKNEGKTDDIKVFFFTQKLKLKSRIFEQQLKFGSINDLPNEDINFAQWSKVLQQVLMAE